MLTENDSSNKEVGLPKTELMTSNAQSMLQEWQSDGIKLEFGYFRSGGAVMQTGTAKVLRAKPGLLTLDTGGSHIAVFLNNARFEYGNLGSLTADFRAVHDVEGLSIILENHDWICLSADTQDI